MDALALLPPTAEGPARASMGLAIVEDRQPSADGRTVSLAAPTTQRHCCDGRRATATRSSCWAGSWATWSAASAFSAPRKANASACTRESRAEPGAEGGSAVTRGLRQAGASPQYGVSRGRRLRRRWACRRGGAPLVLAGAQFSATKASTRALSSSRTRRNTASRSSSVPAAATGSSTDQCMRMLTPGKMGQFASASSQTVMR